MKSRYQHNPTGVTLTQEQARQRRSHALALFEEGVSVAELQVHPDLKNLATGGSLSVGSVERMLQRARKDLSSPALSTGERMTRSSGVRERAKQVALRVFGNPQLTDDQLGTLAELLTTHETRMLLHG